MLNRLLLFVMAACLGTLFLKMELPIPYLLGGIFAAVACKIAGSPVTWPKNWRELGINIELRVGKIVPPKLLAPPGAL